MTERRGIMDDARWEKWASATGIGFVAALVAGYTIAPQPPKLSDSAARFADYFVHNQSSLLVGTVLAAGVGGVMLLWWLGSLRLFLRRRESDGGRLSAVAFGGGLVGLAILIQSLAIRAALAFGLSGTVDPSISKGLYSVAYTVDALNAFPIGALLVAASVSALRSGAFPKWLVWFGLLAGVARWVTGLDVVLKESVFGDEGAIGFVVFVIALAWIVTASIVMIRRSPSAMP
jgi:hypothetical protein